MQYKIEPACLTTDRFWLQKIINMKTFHISRCYGFVNIIPHDSQSNGGVPFLESTMLGHNIILFSIHPLHPFVRFLARNIESLNLNSCPGFGVFIVSLIPVQIHSH